VRSISRLSALQGMLDKRQCPARTVGRLTVSFLL
jgi:hypothetical protein